MAELLSPAARTPFPPVISDAVRNAAADFFRASCGLPFRECPDNVNQPAAGIMSTIAFMGPQPWSFSLALPDHTASEIARAFAGFDIPADSQDMGDVIGEVVNVIAGAICAQLDTQGIRYQMSLPTVVRGGNISVLVPSGALGKRMEFAGPNGACWFRLVKARAFGEHRMPGM